MKTFFNFLLVFLLGIIPLYGKDYYVSTTGSDASDGSLANPFLTIQKASDVAVAGDIVYVLAGTYREMVDLKADGVTYQPYNGESVTINGADLLTDWTLTSGSTYQTTMNWNVDVTWGSNQLFSDGKMIELARWPDQTSSDIVVPTVAKPDNVTAAGDVVTFTDADFNEPDGRWAGAQIWVNLSNGENDGQGWTGTVTSTNLAAHTITFSFPAPRLGNVPWGLTAGTEYFLFNPAAAGVNATGGPDALLSNGEWWKSGTTLYVKTPNGEAPGSAGAATNVIESKKRHFAFYPSVPRAAYTIKGFNLFACAITTDNNASANRGSILEEAHDIIIDGITARYVSHQTDCSGNWQKQHVSWTGFVLSGRNNTLKNSDIQFSATSALSVQGFGNKILNNTIANTNYLCSNAGAFNIECIDAEIADNTMYNTTIMAVYFSACSNSDVNNPDQFRIHHNTIYNFMRRSGDSGALDEGGADFQWGRIDHNVIYNNTPITSSMVSGIYLDWGSGPYNTITRLTIDHNVIYNVVAPILVNNDQYINIYNNVLLSNSGQNTIVDWNGPNGHGIGIKIYNNIMSSTPNMTGSYGDLGKADLKNNITNATGSVLTSLFVDPTNANPAIRDFRLLPTAALAIDKGKSVGVYDENIVALVDLGAFEYGTITDIVAPTVPSGLTGHTASNSGFALSWTASTDNVQVTKYVIYLNGAIFDSTSNTSYTFTGLNPSTLYSATVLAKDYYNNSSAQSTPVNVTTLSYPGRTIHLESENASTRSGGNIIAGTWASYISGKYLQFNNVGLSKQINFTANVSCTAAGEAGGAKLEVRLNSPTGPLLGTLIITSTGDALKFSQQNLTLTGTPTGGYNLYIVATSTTTYNCRLDWVELSGGDIVGAIPSVPEGFSTSLVGGTRFKLSWVGSIDDIVVTGYEVYKDNVLTGTTTTNSILLESLIPSTSYNLEVRATDADGNWSAKSQVYTGTTNTPKFTGTLIGTAGSFGDHNPDDFTAVYDGDINTFFDCTTGDYAWAGIDLGAQKIITSILFYPRSDFPSRMNGGVFQASNTANFSAGVTTLYTVSSQPSVDWNEIIINNLNLFRYVRYKAPIQGYGNIAEAEFYGKEIGTGIPSIADTNTLSVYPNPAADQISVRNIPANSMISIFTSTGKMIYKQSITNSGEATFDVSKLKHGMYILKVTDSFSTKTAKIAISE
jgi:chitodextrinase